MTRKKRPPVLRAKLVGGERQRPPGVEALRKLQLVGQDADDPERSAGDLDCLSDHGWIAAETALPERVTEDGDAGVPGFLLVTREPPAERGLHAEHRKERAGRAAETDVLRRVGADEVWKRTSCPGSRYGSGFSKRPRTTLKTLVVAPMASASVTTTTAANPGARSKSRSAARTSWRSPSIPSRRSEIHATRFP
jgi:hypothetical protein